MMPWSPSDLTKEVPETWAEGNSDVMNVCFNHGTEGVFAFGENVEFRHQSSDATLAATTTFTASRKIEEGSDPIENVIIDKYQALENDLAATSNGAVSFRLSALQGVAEIHSIAFTIFHELIYVPAIGGDTVDSYNIPCPSDTHVTSSGDLKLG